jgi:cytochrome c oxidase subunit III
MSLYQDVTNKPWDNVGLPDGIESKPVFAVPNERVALTVLLIIASVLFSLFLVSYYIRMQVGDWVPLATPPQLWINTAALVLSSIFLQVAVFRSRKEITLSLLRGSGLLFVVGGLMAVVFIVGQYQVWLALGAAGHSIRSNPANSFFYLLTAVHIAHLLGGLWVWSKAGIRLAQKFDADDIRLSMNLCAIYWHFLLLVWVGLFVLLANT